ncbi:hypothetical protein AALB51_23235 [Lachnospiraceae bacterium 62-26]
MVGNRRGRRSRKLLKRISRYSGYWQLICTPGDEHMNMVTARNVVKCLAKNGLHEFIFVFLYVHRDEEFIKSMLSFISLDLLSEEIRHNGMDGIIRMLDEHLR